MRGESLRLQSFQSFSEISESSEYSESSERLTSERLTLNEARAVRDLGATLCELVEIKSELRLAGREARFERPHACGEIAEEHVM